MAEETGAGYLTTGQVARWLGVSKGRILRAVEVGTLQATHKMPGGALRFAPPDVDRYAQHLMRERRGQLVATRTDPTRPGAYEDAPDTSQAASPDPLMVHQVGPAVQSGGARQPVVSGLTLASMLIASRQRDVKEEISNILTLVADSLQVAVTCLARVAEGKWYIDLLYDRAGMGLRVGEPLPYSSVYGQTLADGDLQCLIVEDLRADLRFSALANPEWRVGALTALPLASDEGYVYGAFCTIHPNPRAITSGETSLLRLAGRMVTEALEAAVRRERKRQWAQQLSRYAALVEESHDAIVSTDAAGNIETWNRGAARLYGYTAEEVIGRSFTMLAAPERVAESSRLLLRLARGERIPTFETTSVRKDGMRFEALLTLSPIRDNDDNVVSVSVVARDVTGRAKAEQALRFQATLLDSVGQAVVATDLTGIVTYWNRSAELLYGWSAAEVIGRDVKEINLWPMPSDGAAPLLDDYTSSTAWSGEVTVRHQDGGTLLALVTHNPILDTEGVVAGRVSVALDISELRPVVDAGSGGEVHGSGMLLDVTERYPSEELP